MPIYDAFISYSHAQDKPIAAALQSVVQRLGKPWYKRRALRVFRDDTSLSATPQLWPSIEQALAQSRFLILLASPEAAASPWVGKEVAYWLDHKSSDTLLIALTNGTLAWDQATGDFAEHQGMPLPAVLKGRFPSEPKWVNLSAYRGGAAPRDAKFEELGADFAAAIRGVPKEDVLSQEVRQQRRALRLAWSATGLLLMLAGFAAWQWNTAVEERKIAQAQRDRAERNLEAATRTAETLAVDMAQEFRNRSGMPVDLVRRILDRALGLLRELTQAGEMKAHLRHREASALLELAKTYLAQGDTHAALTAAREARDIMEAFLAVVPEYEEWQRGFSISNDLIGDALAAGGRRGEALEAYRSSLAIREQLAKAVPENTQWQRDLLVSLNRIAGLSLGMGQREQALELYRRGLDIARKLASDPDNALATRDVAVSYERIGSVLFALGRREEAFDAHRASLDLLARIAAADLGSAEAQRDLLVSSTKIGDVLMAVAKDADALAVYRRGLAIAEKLGASDQGNALWQRDLAISYSKIGSALFARGQFQQALENYRKSLAITQRLSAANHGSMDLRRELSIDLNNVGDTLRALGRTAEALDVYRNGLVIAEELVAAADTDREWQRDLSVSLNKVGDLLAEVGQAERAIASYRRSLAIREKLTLMDPASAQWQSDLVLTLVKLAKAGDDSKARLTRALEILQRLDAEDRLPASQKSWIKIVEQALAELPR